MAPSTPSALFPHRFAVFLKEALADLGDARGSKGELARRLEITPEYLSRLLHGKKAPSLDLAHRAGRAFGFDAEKYFFGTMHDRRYSDFGTARVAAAEGARGLAIAVMVAGAEGRAIDPKDALALAKAVLDLPIVRRANEVVNSPGNSAKATALAAAVMHVPADQWQQDA